MVLEAFLGNSLIKNDGTHIKTGDLSSEHGGIIGLYFSAHWCPPCRGFTPKLSSVYNEIKSLGNNFEIVFVSWDRDEDAFKSYHGEMPWLAIPFDSAKEKDGCTEKFKVEGIPSLVLLDAATGDIVKSNGREAVDCYGAAGFPFTDARLEVCKKEKEEARNKALKELSTLSFLAPLTKVVEDQEKDVDLQKATSSCEAVAFAFMKGARCQGSSLVLPKLVEIQEKLGESKLKVILVPMEDLSEFSEELKSKIKNTTMVKFGERSKDTVKRFEVILSEIESPHVLVIATENDSSLKIVAENAARDIHYVGAAGFPWSEKALDDLKAKEEAQVKEWKTKQDNLEFFSQTEECHILDKSGKEVSLAMLQSKEVVGIYFSAHWCGPCRAFTPKLVEVYKQCKEQGRNFEVVFLSSDRSKAAFDEYYAEMPWYALSYDDRNVKGILSKVFNVRGIPKLVLLTGAGEVITEDGRSAVGYGADYFPWNKEQMEKGKKEEEKREKELLEKAKEAETKVAQEQKDAKKVVIQRHK